MLEFIIENKESIKLVYGLAIVLVCAIIVVKSDRLFRLSLHQGIRYFRNAFLFFGVGFLIRYLFGAEFFSNLIPFYNLILTPLFEFFFIMAGFFLIYSLLWKKFESVAKSRSSLVNIRIIVFYMIALVLVLLDYIWDVYYFMFFSQILVFVFATIISFLNYQRNGYKHKFLKFYFLAMLMILAAWVLNALAALYFNWNQNVIITVYALNLIIFLLFLWGVIRVTKK